MLRFGIEREPERCEFGGDWAKTPWAESILGQRCGRQSTGLGVMGDGIAGRLRGRNLRLEDHGSEKKTGVELCD